MRNLLDQRTLGAAAGGVVAAVRSQGLLRRKYLVLEAAGGAVGGFLGAMLPDIFDLSDASAGSRWGASAAQVGIVGYQVSVRMDRAQAWARGKAEHFEKKALAASADGANFLAALYHLVEGFFAFIAGALLGAPLGYLTHLFANASAELVGMLPVPYPVRPLG